MKNITSLVTLSVLLLCLTADAAFYQFNVFTTNGWTLGRLDTTNMPNPITTMTVGTIIVNGTSSNSFQLNGTNGQAIIGINPTNNTVTLFGTGVGFGGNSNALTNNETRQVVFAGTGSNSVSIVSTSGVAFFRSNPTNSSITIGNGDLQPAGVPAGANFIGGVTVITNLARTIQTNFISGLPYTNFTPTSQFVSYKFIATVAASAGDNAIASLSLIDPSEGYTVFTSISDGGETTTALSIARVVHFTVSGFVPSGAYYTFTNQCTGANTGTFVSGSGRLTQF